MIEKFLNDKSHITVDDCDKILAAHGYKLKKKGGSHQTYHKKGAIPITVITPKNSKYVLIAYVKLIVKYLNLED